MKRKIFISFLLTLLCSVMAHAQQEITMDSILRTIDQPYTLFVVEDGEVKSN